MKRMLAAFLALLAVSGLLMVSAGAVKTTTKSYTLDAKYVESYAGSAKVEVTVNGYIGSLDKKACDLGSGLGADDSEEIIVLKSGSDVKFTIKASNPNAYYNYCYTKGVKALEEKAAAEGNTYPAIYDDCGGGVMLTREGDNFGSLSMFVWPNDDGTAKMNAAGFNVASGRKISNNTYAYTAHDGLYSFAFQSKDKNGDPVMDSYGYEARYELGTFLFVTDEQIAAMIYRAWKYIGEETGCAVPSETKAFAAYADKSKVSGYAVETVGVLATCGVMKGTSETQLSPKNSCTIEMCILLIYRLYQRF